MTTNPDLSSLVDDLRAKADEVWALAEPTRDVHLHRAWLALRQAAVFAERAIPRDQRPDDPPP